MSLPFTSLRTKWIAAFVAFVLVPLLGASLYTYKEIENVLRHQVESSAEERLHQINLNIERKLQTMMHATASLVIDENVKRALLRPPATERDMLDNTHVMDKKFLEMSTSTASDSFYFSVFDNFGSLYTNWGRTPQAMNAMKESEWFRRTLEENGYMVWTLNHASYASPDKQALLSVSMVFRDESNRGIGQLVISEPTQSYLDILQIGHPATPGFGLLVGPGDQALTPLPEEALPLYEALRPVIESSGDGTVSTQANGDKYVLSTYSLPMTGWKIVQIVPHGAVFREIDRIRNVSIAIFSVSMVVFLGVIVFFSNMLTRPLRKLRNVMKQVEKGRLDVAVEVKTRDEAGLLGQAFNKMLERLQGHIDREIVLERRHEQAKLEALQAQINPHFLHNTLNTIRWMSIMAGTKPITEMLMSLGHLLDMSIHRGQDRIILREEMDNVRYFMTIQRYRFGDHVTVSEQLEEGTLDALVPKLSLQPLVENVYRHASFQEGRGEMLIRSRIVSPGELLLEIVDNGLEVNKERLRDIAERIGADERSAGFTSVGLRNVHKRVRMMYGDGYGVAIRRAEEEGRTFVSIRLPLQRNSESETEGREDDEDRRRGR
ncbi:sensor histidine kinase [Cohnella sp. LGH]|uniref:cache domain-containing sensor histidine kinase n=1 Tax=Cohnella sp. LGH TaxID=1619153 RepID=UPI001ADB6BE6|nr:sensor histidine kinase [Cohnella sp. LGH]QTH43445.1 sensor histidine kinase [Cohnella sp. LGH]